MDYPCGKFGDCSFSRFGFYHADKQTDRITNAAAKRLTPATVVGE